MIRRSFALRAALVAALLMLVASLFSAGWVWFQAGRTLRAQLDLSLATEAEALVRAYEVFGIAGLVQQAHDIANRRGSVLILLQSAEGRPIAGDLTVAVPPLLRGFATLERPSEGTRLRALGALLPTGVNLIVAGDLAPLEAAAARLAWEPVGAAIAAAILALVLGFLGARGLERRFARTGDAARAIMDGDLSRRLPQTGTGDEFDRLAETMNGMLARIEALMVAQRQVTDDIAHDLRTPLSRLRQRLEGALAKPRDATADRDSFEAALVELDQVLATFRGLLQIARAESGAVRREFRSVDLSALAAGIAEAYGPVAEESNRELKTQIAPGLRLDGDAALLRQALANLIDNALLHGGPHVAFRLLEGPVIEVSDDGPGIRPEDREAVQRRFHRLDSSRNTPGTGLGLALVAATARLHGGALQITDGPDGSGVTMRIDLRSAQASADRPGAVAPHFRHR